MVRVRGEHRTRFFVLSCFLPSWQDRTKTKNASCPVFSSDEHFLSCPAFYLRPVLCSALMSIFCPVLLPSFVLSYRTRHQDRLSCAQLWFEFGSVRFPALMCTNLSLPSLKTNFKFISYRLEIMQKKLHSDYISHKNYTERTIDPASSLKNQFICVN